LGFAKNFHELPLEDLMAMLREPSSERQFLMYEALRKGATTQELFEKTYIKHWFIEQMRELVELEERMLQYRGNEVPDELLVQAKKYGFADKYLSQILGVPEPAIRERRTQLGVVEGWHAVPVSGVENAAYYYSTYNAPDAIEASDNPNKVLILGGGPNRIGQGIEFDYCCVHAAFALRDMGYETVMVNCNPETVSTDYDTSDKLYFEPVTVEDVLQIYAKERPKGVICQFGGQTPLNLAAELKAAGVNILGTSPETIDLAEDRDRFRRVMSGLGIPMADSGMASTIDEALGIAERIGYPLMVRPSYVLGGRGMEIVHDEEMLRDYVAAAVGVTPDRPILIDKYLENAIEAEADAIADGTDAFVPAVMEHIELAGVHSGDSACVIPPTSIPQRHLDTIYEYTRKIASEMNVVGLMNIQYAICNDRVYVLEANPRASRTVPLVSKVCGLSMARVATEIMLGRKLSDLDLKARKIPHFGVKEAVFPFPMFPEVDPLLGPEMRSTGEVLGMADSFGLAFYKAQDAARPPLPTLGSVLLTISARDRGETLVEVAKRFEGLGFKIKATEGTQQFLAEQGVETERIFKMNEGRPNIVDGIMNGEIQLVVNTPAGKLSAEDDSYIRKAARSPTSPRSRRRGPLLKGSPLAGQGRPKSGRSRSITRASCSRAPSRPRPRVQVGSPSSSTRASTITGSAPDRIRGLRSIDRTSGRASPMRPSASRMCASFSRSAPGSPRNAPRMLPCWRASISSFASCGASGATAKATSRTTSANTPPSPNMTHGPNCGSRISPAINSRLPETIDCTRTPASLSSGRRRASRSAVSRRTSSASLTSRRTRFRSVLCAIPRPQSFRTTG
jgi:carbamoyl-phosphate synthase large subunit